MSLLRRLNEQHYFILSSVSKVFSPLDVDNTLAYVINELCIPKTLCNDPTLLHRSKQHLLGCSHTNCHCTLHYICCNAVEQQFECNRGNCVVTTCIDALCAVVSTGVSQLWCSWNVAIAIRSFIQLLPLSEYTIQNYKLKL